MQGFMLTISVKNIRKNALFNIVTACQLGKISISVEPVYQVKFDLIRKKQLQKWPKNGLGVAKIMMIAPTSRESIICITKVLYISEGAAR